MGGSYKCMPGSDPGDGCYNYRVVSRAIKLEFGNVS